MLNANVDTMSNLGSGCWYKGPILRPRDLYVHFTLHD